jgi:hypothetical protein
MTAEDSTKHSNTTNDTLPHHNPSHHITPIPVEIFPPSTAGEDQHVMYQFRYGPTGWYAQAVVLLPFDGVLRACGLVQVRVSNFRLHTFKLEEEY